MTLYEINAQLQELIENSIDPETGEIVVDDAQLEDLEVAREEKIENIALYIKNLTSEALAIKAEIDNLSKRKKVAENAVERMKQYLQEQLNGEKFSTPRVSIFFRSSSALELDNNFIEWAMSNGDTYLRFKSPEPDKKAITEALKNGEVIPGAELVTRKNMSIK